MDYREIIQQGRACRYDVLASGYVSMDRIIKISTPAKVGFTSLVQNKTSADVQYGGCSVNIAHNMCKLGRVAMPVMRVGDDFESVGFKGFLENSGIPLDALEHIEGEMTSLCYLVQDNLGQHITLFYPGAMDAKHALPLDAELFRQSRLGVMTVGSLPDNEIFFSGCRDNGVPLVFCMKGDMDAFPRDFLRDLLEYSSVIFTNEVERQTIEEIFGFEITELMHDANAGIIVTTLGEEGSRCYYNEGGTVKSSYVPICAGGSVVDTTGSGDAYVSGFLYGMLNGEEPEQCARMGTVLSSFVIEREGCCTGAPGIEQFRARYTQFKEGL